MRFATVCSGIGAPECAWQPLGWTPAWCAEIEPLPSAVLSYHFPDVPNLGDMTTIADRIRTGEVETPDLLCGGTPCQSFSTVGLRRSLNDDRGNLALAYVEIANAIDNIRSTAGLGPAWCLWENVPGVLSTHDNAFGCFLGAMGGCESAIDAPVGGWPRAGVVAGPRRVVAWRTLDAKHFGLAQRRKRVFVLALGGPRGWACADALLPVGDRRAWHPAPRRETGQATAYGVAPSLTASGRGTERTGESRGQDCLIPEVVHTLRGGGFDASEDGTVRGTPFVPVAFSSNDYGRDVAHDLSPTLRVGQTMTVGYVIHGAAGRTGKGDSAQRVATYLRVRRMLPVEAERLQGLPDGWTAIQFRGKPAADYPRYRAIGNSMAVSVVRWIGERISEVMKFNNSCDGATQAPRMP